MRGYIDGVATQHGGEPPFHVGDLVVLDNYYTQERRKPENFVVRKVIEIKKSSCGTAWKLTADGGSPCPVCGLTASNRVRLSAGWFINAVTGFQIGQQKDE